MPEDRQVESDGSQTGLQPFYCGPAQAHEYVNAVVNLPSIFAPINVPSSMSCSPCLKTAGRATRLHCSEGADECGSLCLMLHRDYFYCMQSDEVATMADFSHRQSGLLPPHLRPPSCAFLPPARNFGKGKRHVRILHRRTPSVISEERTYFGICWKDNNTRGVFPMIRVLQSRV